MTKTQSRGNAVTHFNPATAVDLQRALWGISQYYDRNTMRFHRSRILTAEMWLERSSDHPPFILALESTPDAAGKRLYRVNLHLGAERTRKFDGYSRKAAHTVYDRWSEGAWIAESIGRFVAGVGR